MAVHVVYSSSDYYSQCTGISILSLLENNKDINELHLYILDTDITNINKDKIIEIARSYKRSIKFIPAQEQFDENVNKLKLSYLRGSYNTYARIMLNAWFDFLDKILLIDSDTLIIGSIKELWETDLSGKLLAAVPEIAVYAKNSLFEDPDIVNGCDYYYNMGVVLCNLKQWRDDEIDSFLESKVQEYKKDFYIADQSILNYALNDRIERLHLRYNYYTAMHGVPYRTMEKTFSMKKIFSEREFFEAREKPVIIHFVGHPFERPWFKRSTSQYKLLYQSYRKKTPWKDENLLFSPAPKNLIFRVYDYLTYIILKCRMYSFAHWFRYILGQRIKKISKQKR